MKLRSLSAVALVALLAACGSGKYEKTSSGITVNVEAQKENDVRKVRLQVFGDKIIRVSATPDKEFTNDTSLVVLDPPADVKFDVEETDSTVSVVTSAIKATVSLSTGDVKFYNKDGKLIVKEAEGGREFSPIKVEDTEGYTVRQVFESLNEEEGIYGLGQHQADEFNYKGKNEELFQYNTKVSVPLLCRPTTMVSSGTAIHSAVGEIRRNTSSSAVFSNFMTKTARKVPLLEHMCRLRKMRPHSCSVKTLYISSILSAATSPMW